MTLAAEAIDVALGGVRVLKSVSAAIRPGRITGLIGPNGAGKSTLLKAMSGLIEPGKGRVALEGRALGGFSRQDLARHLAYLPQERIVHWPLAIRAVAGLGRLPHRDGSAGGVARDATAVAAALAAMDVTALAERPIGEVSGGERARALFARALAQEARYILADEPAAGLDPAHALELFAVLARLATDGRAIGVALHDLSLAARFCHDVVLLRDGELLASGPARDVMSGAQLSAAFGVRMIVGQFDTIPIVLPVAPL